MQDVQARVQRLIDDLVDRDVERGLQVAAYLNGELVVDAWAGVADASTGRPVDGDTLFTVWSVTKGVAATAIHVLADRGQLDYDTPIAEYWPEFGVNGKQRITLRHALTHTSGIPQMPENLEPEDVINWDRMCRAIAELRPLWEPGTATGYHAMTYGWVVGEVARRVDGRPIERIIQDEICAPLGIASLFLGIPDEVEPRVAMLESAPLPEPPPQLPPDALVTRTVPTWRQPAHPWANHPATRRASLPASGGIMNARAIARHYAALACGGQLDGVQILAPERVKIASALQVEAIDLVFGTLARRALGYHLGEPLSPMSERITAFGHAGMGGSFGFADPEYRFAFGLTKTRMVEGPPEQRAAYLVAREVRAALGIPER